MSCGPEPTTFRIFGADASWELDLVADADHPGAVIGEAIELALRDPAAVDLSALVRVMAPPWIARGCDTCEWYLIAPPEDGPAALLRFAPCAGAFAAIACHLDLIAPAAVAAARGMVAVLDPGRGELLVLSAGGERVILAIPCRARGPIAFAGRSILVADGRALWAHELISGDRRALPPAPAPIARLAVTPDGAPWAAIERAEGLGLVRLEAAGWRPAALAELIAAKGAAGDTGDTGVRAASDRAACVEVPRDGLAPITACVDRRGRVIPAVPPDAPRPRHTQGTIITRAPLDSSVARCQWHRVRLDLELPERTGLEIALATTEKPNEEITEGDWQVVDAGPLTAAPPAGRVGQVCDFLIDQPPGRYLTLRLTLRGDGARTPRIRRIRIDFPRSTSAAHLPGVYREDPLSAGFLERFLSLFDAELADLDRVIERFPALLDPASTPAEALPWLGKFLDIALDPAWPEATRRALLAEAPALYRGRGTPAALARAIELITGVRPAITELGGAVRPFRRLAAACADARAAAGEGDPARSVLGEVRLFGRARARLRLGASPLGGAALRSYGDPDRDHLAALGLRIAIQIPGGAGTSPDAAERLRRLVDAQKPAHVEASVRVGGTHLLLGVTSAVGIDTRLGGVPASYLGTNALLGRRTVLARGPRRGGASLAVGTSSAIAIQTVLS